MPTEAEMRAHDSDYEGSVHTIPRSVHRQPYAVSKVTASVCPRPVLNIYANRYGDVAYEPDQNWSRQFGKRGYKINIVEVGGLHQIDDGPARLHGQYAVQKDGALRVNGHKVPMLRADGGERHVLDGFEHGRVFAPNLPYVAPGGFVRDKMGKNWCGKEMRQADIKCTRPKVFCVLGGLAALVLGCVLVNTCH
jgi:hypothetical protein